MFDKYPRDAEGHIQISVSVPLKPDEQGYLDKECPSEQCMFSFKVHGDDWAAIIRDEEVFCPRCGHSAAARSWYTTEQVKVAKEQALEELKHEVSEEIRGMLQETAREFNNSQAQNALIKMTMSVSEDRTAKPVVIPVSATEPMTKKQTCSKCGCRFGYVGAAFFCPSCGFNSAEQTFTQALDTIRTTLTNEEKLRNIFDRDTAENTVRILRENALEDAVTSFQRMNESLYARVPNAAVTPRNAFQRVFQGSALWKNATGKGYEDFLTSADLASLNKYFQQRHLLSHQDGIVDEDYRIRSGDNVYRVGQRLIVRREDVMDMVGLIEKLINAVRTLVP